MSENYTENLKERKAIVVKRKKLKFVVCGDGRESAAACGGSVAITKEEKKKKRPEN